ITRYALSGNLSRRTSESNGLVAEREAGNICPFVNDLSLTRVAASDKELNDVAVRVRGRRKSGRSSCERRVIGRRCAALAKLRRCGDHTRTKNGGRDVKGLVIVKAVRILLIKVMPVSKTESPPTSREDANTCEAVDRVMLKSIRSAAAHIAERTELKNRLEVLVDRKVHTYRGKEFISAVKK